MNARNWIVKNGYIIGSSLIAVVAISMIGLATAGSTLTARATSDIAAPLRPSDTVWSTDIVTDTTWTLANSPYSVTAAITVLPTATLTIEPGVVVMFDDYTGLTINGRLIASGTSAQSITLTATSAISGSWSGLRFVGTPSAPLTGSRLDYVMIEYGGWNAYGTNLYVEQAAITVTHSLFRYSSQDGVLCWTNGVANIADSQFVGNTGFALHLFDGSVNPTLSNLTATGNGTDGIGWDGGDWQGDHVWNALPIPYVVRGTETIGPTATLTIKPGALLEFDHYAGLTIRGRLTAQGTVTQPITFTATSLTPGWWTGVLFDGPSANAPLTGSSISYATINYGGYNNGADVYAADAIVTVTHSLLSYSSTDGFHAHNGGSANIADSNFVGNAGYALSFFDLNGMLNPQLSNLTASGNGYDAVAFGGGTLEGAQT